ncbi:MAG: histidine--tRNA ligase [Ignavibacteria bacterium]|jgi:histidyl-tRNA synthetase|nr:histidine--tRNA ligase [Ignavibacteria bacterium]
MITKPKGTIDFLPEDTIKRQHIEKKLRNIASVFNYKEIRTPTFEKTELFKRSIGEETDIVAKEMYTFSGDEFTLKPEMTAPVIRAYLENNLYNISPVHKLYYISNMFRHERPQAGRFREFSQFGAELIGSSDYTADIDLIALGYNFLSAFGIEEIKIKINNIGNLSERSAYIDELKRYLESYHNDLSEDSRKRLSRNPLRILDSKDKKDREIIKHAPVLYDFLGTENKKHFQNVLEGLNDMKIDFETDYSLVRGLDYYTSTTFEILSDTLGAQNALLGGGRYDILSEQIGGRPTPAIGFACGLERLSMVLESVKYDFPLYKPPVLYFVTSGETAKKKIFPLINKLRMNGICCETDLMNRSIKSQMKEANRLNSSFVIVVGENELNTNEVNIKRMSDGSEIKVQFDNLLNYSFE